MRKYLTILSLLCLFVITAVHAQTGKPVSTGDINALLAKFPAQDAAQSESNMQAIAAMGDNGVEQMASMLMPAGKGDNTALEYALSAFSNYVTKPGKEDLKNQTAAAYARALQNISDKENKAFLIRQLQVTGNDGSVAVLKTYLPDERLCDPAARALVKINTQAAHKALAAALQHATGDNRLTLIEALGDTRYQGAAPLIATHVHGSDSKLVKLSLYALARIGDTASRTLLFNAAEKSGFTYEPSGATAALLAYAEQLSVNGHASTSEKIANLILLKAVADKQVHTRTAALKLLVDIKGEKSIPLLVNAMNDKNAEYREAALKFTLAFKGDAAIAPWIKKLNTSGPTVKAEIITMLGIAGNPAALPAALKELQDKDAAVKSAAIKAAVQTGQQQALPGLLQAMKNGSQEDITNVTNALLMMKGPDVTNQVAGALPTMQPGMAKSALIHVLAARSADNSINAVLPLVKSEDTTVSNAAFSALKTMVKQENLPQLFALLTSVNPQYIQSVQDAIIAATSTITDTSARTKLIVDQMKQSPVEKQYLFFGILSGIGGKEALKTVTDAYATGNPQTKIQAIHALAGWADAGSASALLQISRDNSNPAGAEQALGGYIQLAARSTYPPEQKLLMLRNAMAIAQTTSQKQLILKETGKCKTYQSLLFTGTYLDDPALQHEAAYAVMKIALSNKAWYGESVSRLLEKTIGLLDGQDANYDKQAIRKHLSDLPTGEGFVSLFNEKDLTGWKGLVDNPIQRAAMNADTLAKKQQAADERMRKGWFAKNGELVFSGNGDNLCTTKKYGDFEMFVDWKITKDGDAGIYLRGSPQVQIWDTARVNVGAQVGSGGLYNNATYPSKPLKLADNAIGEWNSFHIIMIGDRVTVYLNGELVVNNIILENYWDRNLPIFPEEQIELQAHGTYVAYRDLYIREIPRTQPFTLNEEEKKAGFKVLFDGTNMQQWTGNTTDYVLDEGNIAIYPQNGGHGNLYTKNEYSDFVYRFEFQLTPGANNGIGIRAPLEGDAAYVGMEIQVLDNEADMYKNLHAYQYHGSVYGVIPAKRGFLKPVGEWNEEEITAKGSKIKVVLNGTTILDGDIEEASKNGTMDGRDHPGLKRTKGHIGFLGHGDIVKFRHVRVREL